jgi:RNA-directed DNA polymerase
MAMERREPPRTERDRDQLRKQEESQSRSKPFGISQAEVWAAYRVVKANRGAAGLDGQTIAEFERDLHGNLYKLWNRMASGSYMPPPVKRVLIPKASGGTRPLGVPTVADRVAQTVVKRRLEPVLEPHFHNNSYGYRPGKAAHQALGMARIRCWERAWVLDVDITAFFDNLDHTLLMQAVERHTRCRWMRLYITRWLTAPVQLPDGSVQERTKGTPQGGVISPLLANLFLHYTFDQWMVREARHIRFERYADDILCHCQSRAQAEALRKRLTVRMADCQLALHPDKTKIVYCRDERRRDAYPEVSFDFLGYTFKPRKVRRCDGRYETGFAPAISGRAARALVAKLRAWGFRRRIRLTLNEVREVWNPILRGWVTYYGRYYRSRLYTVLAHFDRRLAQWAAQKFKRGRVRGRAGLAWVARLKQHHPTLFAHWEFFAGAGVPRCSPGRAG